ncbi:MAG: hypothetical protein ACYTGZ_17485 [Planctomycetota bacterium]
MMQRWDQLWFSESSLLRLAAFRIAIVFVALLEFFRYAAEYLLETRGRDAVPMLYREYQPLYALEVLGLEPPGPVLATIVIAVLGLAIVLGLIGLFTRTALALTSILSLYLYATMYSFGQAHHDKVALALALLVLPLAPAGCRLSVDRLRGKTCDGMQRTFAGWPIRFVQVSIALGYCAAGITKLAVGGLGWMNGYSLQAKFVGSGAVFSNFAASSLPFAIAMSVGVVLLQATFPLCLFVRPLRWIYVPGIVAFQLGTTLTVGTRVQYGMTVVVAVAFIPFDRILNRAFGMTDD